MADDKTEDGGDLDLPTLLRDSYDIDTGLGGGSLESAASVSAREHLQNDIQLEEVIQDDAVLRELAEREFDMWLNRFEEVLNTAGITDQASLTRMNRYYVACFYKTYKDELQELADKGHNIEQMAERTLPPQRPSIGKFEDERGFQKTWITDHYDPWQPNGRSLISTAASVAARETAEGHANVDANGVAVVRGTAALESLARRSFDHWLSNEIGKLGRRAFRKELESLDAEEMCRLWVISFTDQYRSTTRRLEYKELVPKQPDGPVIRVLDTRHTADARIYDIELIDPEHSEGPIRFEVVVQSDGEAELRER